MVSTILIDGAIKLVKIIRYRNKPAVARIFTPGQAVPDKVMEASKYNDNRFLDDDNCKEYRLTRNGMVAI